jgi:hypothetical protein
MVFQPNAGYGGAMETSYSRHSKYADYKTNPAFANISDVKQGSWTDSQGNVHYYDTVDFSFVVPEGGFVLTCHDEVMIDALVGAVLGIARDGEGYREINNSAAFNVDNVRVAYDAETGRVSVKVVELAPEQPELGEGVSVVIESYAAANSWTNGTLYETVAIDEHTSVKAVSKKDTGYAPNSGKYYTSGFEWRIYQSEAAQIEITSTKTIAAVAVEYASKNTGVFLNGETVVESGAVVLVNGTTLTLTVGNTTEGVNNGQAKVTKITIYYAE